MKYTKEIINAMRTASYLIEPPASEVIGGLLDEIERLRSENEWIPVSERLPEVKGEYLCYLKPDMFISFFGDSWSGTLAFRSVIAPAHWRPLPQPPEAE